MLLIETFINTDNILYISKVIQMISKILNMFQKKEEWSILNDWEGFIKMDRTRDSSLIRMRQMSFKHYMMRTGSYKARVKLSRIENPKMWLKEFERVEKLSDEAQKFYDLHDRCFKETATKYSLIMMACANS